MGNVTLSNEEYQELKEKAELNESLLLKLVRGLEDIREGRVKPWKRSTG
jgi:hypothetical protein